MPIPSNASAVHGIYNDDVAHEPGFPHIASGLAELLLDCDLAGSRASSWRAVCRESLA